jgi:hypothetical protein
MSATTTTHKTLRGPRGGMILTNDEALAKKFNSAIFPGIQGGPLMHVIAAKAVAFGEALRPEFKDIPGAGHRQRAGAGRPADQGRAGHRHRRHRHPSDAGRPAPKGVKGNATEKALGRAHITCNKNGIPFDPEKPMVTSGVRLGSPAAPRAASARRSSARSADWIVEVVDGLAANGEDGNGACMPARRSLRDTVVRLTGKSGPSRATGRNATTASRHELLRNLCGYFFTLWLTVLAWPIWWLVVPLIVVNAFAGVRLYVLQHDCGHGSLYSTKRLQ